jgi:F-box interacting protein
MKNHIYQKNEEFAQQKRTSLPQELIIEILSLLPVKCLVRFQYVSKSWFALIINDSYFIKLHLKRSKERTLILETDEPLDYLMVNFSIDDRFGEAVKIKHPLHHLPSTEIVDSCNGLVCIGNDDNAVCEFVIWNPLIRKHKKLPSKPKEKFVCGEYLSFGYDRVNDDYKVLRLVKFHQRARLERVREGRRAYSLDIYSLRENSWRMVEEEWPVEEPYSLSGPYSFSNGAFHWVATPRTMDLKKKHVAFDLSTEKFRVHEFPVNFSIKKRVHFVDLGGWLCAVFEDLCEAWVMKEYGVSSSWTLLYWVQPAFSNLSPLVFSHEGKKVLTGEVMDDHCIELYWYDIKKNTRKIVEIQNMPEYFFLPYTCVGSTVLLLDADSDNYLQ